MKRKIIFATRALWIGGVETALVNLLNSMDYERYDVTCLIVEDATDLADRIDRRCKLIVCDRGAEDYKHKKLSGLAEVPASPSRLHRTFMWTTGLLKAMESRLYADYVTKRLEREYDVAIIYDVYVAEIAVRAVKAKKYFMFYHHGAMGHAYHDEMGYRRSEKIIVVSNILRRKMQEKNPQYAPKMTTIHNIVNVNDILEKSNEKSPISYDQKKFNIVTCGRLSKEKGVDIAFSTCERLVRDGYMNFHWYIVGGGRDQKKLQDMIFNKKLQDYVTMTGETKNPYPYIKQADLYVLPSRFEGYPMTLLEALALDVPVVATKTAGACEILEAGEFGALCEIDSDAAAEKIELLMRDRTMYQYYADRAKAVDIARQNEENMQQFYRLL